uniref:DUF1618 domain-containing protein n=1 Tax=Leersia perrieri TaxID=77586 RepID=A0A0D9XZ52_9ORYZ
MGYVSRPINLPRKNYGTCYLLLTADNSSAVEPFRLLAVRLYDTSANDRQLGPKCPTTKIPIRLAGERHPGAWLFSRKPPVVVNGVNAYFLGLSNSFHTRYLVLRIDVSTTTTAATIVRGLSQLRPPFCSNCCTSDAAAAVAVVTPEQMLLAPSPLDDGKSVADNMPSVWECVARVDTAGVRACDVSGLDDVEMVWSGEASSFVVLRLGGVLCLMDRRSMVILVLDEALFAEFRFGSDPALLPYEIGVSTWQLWYRTYRYLLLASFSTWYLQHWATNLRQLRQHDWQH